MCNTGKEQTCRLITYNREPRNKPTQICPTDFDKGRKLIKWRKDIFSLNCTEATEHPQAKRNKTQQNKITHLAPKINPKTEETKKRDLNLISLRNLTQNGSET